MIGLDWEEKQREKRRNKIIMTLLGIFAVFGFVGIIVTMYLEYEEYLPSENITIVRDNGSEEWGQTEKIIVETIGIAVESYSFDGGINWQESNEFVVIDKSNLSIVVRDLKGKQSEPLLYQTSNVDAIPPVINVKIPAKVIQNSKINLGEYVSATDDNSGLDGTIIMEPASLDTSKLGVKTIKITAKDKAGNVSSISVNVEIIKKPSVAVTSPNPGISGGSDPFSGSIGESGSVVGGGKVTLYRYRVKNTVKYIYRTYDCSYLVDTGKYPMMEAFSNKACTAPNDKITFNTNCYIIPTAKNASCADGYMVVNRYSEYQANGWTYLIDIYALDKDGKQVTVDTSGHATQRPSKYGDALKDAASTNSQSSLESFIPDDEKDKIQASIDKEVTEMYKVFYKEAPCNKNEVNINGYCHLACSGSRVGQCEEGLILVDNKCKKRVEKTCNDICQKHTWSAWSDWSETPISATDSIQVETKIVER